MKLPSLSSPLIGREHHLARPFCAGNVTLFGLHWDERNLEMKFSLSIGHYFNITHTTCVAGNWKINLEAKIKTKKSNSVQFLFGFKLLILCIYWQ